MDNLSNVRSAAACVGECGGGPAGLVHLWLGTTCHRRRAGQEPNPERQGTSTCPHFAHTPTLPLTGIEPAELTGRARGHFPRRWIPQKSALPARAEARSGALVPPQRKRWGPPKGIPPPRALRRPRCRSRVRTLPVAVAGVGCVGNVPFTRGTAPASVGGRWLLVDVLRTFCGLSADSRTLAE